MIRFRFATGDYSPTNRPTGRPVDPWPRSDRLSTHGRPVGRLVDRLKTDSMADYGRPTLNRPTGRPVDPWPTVDPPIRPPTDPPTDSRPTDPTVDPWPTVGRQSTHRSVGRLPGCATFCSILHCQKLLTTETLNPNFGQSKPLTVQNPSQKLECPKSWVRQTSRSDHSKRIEVHSREKY